MQLSAEESRQFWLMAGRVAKEISAFIEAKISAATPKEYWQDYAGHFHEGKQPADAKVARLSKPQ